MTLPLERTRAVRSAYDFLIRLLDRDKTPRVPKKVREEAYRVLRHFPWPSHLDVSAKALPDVWGEVEYDKESIIGKIRAKKKTKNK